jgi:hypothetical protein
MIHFVNDSLLTGMTKWDSLMLFRDRRSRDESKRKIEGKTGGKDFSGEIVGRQAAD